jgi:hypothetical protein
MEAEASPFPREESTPPVTNMNFVFTFRAMLYLDFFKDLLPEIKGNLTQPHSKVKPRGSTRVSSRHTNS